MIDGTFQAVCKDAEEAAYPVKLMQLVRALSYRWPLDLERIERIPAAPPFPRAMFDLALHPFTSKPAQHAQAFAIVRSGISVVPEVQFATARSYDRMCRFESIRVRLTVSFTNMGRHGPLLSGKSSLAARTVLRYRWTAHSLKTWAWQVDRQTRMSAFRPLVRTLQVRHCTGCSSHNLHNVRRLMDRDKVKALLNQKAKCAEYFLMWMDFAEQALGKDVGLSR